MARSMLISGAGIAGPALAYWSLRAGFQPTLVERAPRPRTEGYIIDYWGLGYDLAERMGLGPAMARTGYRVRELRLVDARGRRAGGFTVDVLHALTRGRYTSILRGDLSTLLLQQVESHVDVRYGDSIRSLDQDERGVAVTFEQSKPQRFDLVVGADGLHSKVRELVFGPQATYERYMGYVAAAFALDGYRPRDEGVYVSFTEPGRQVARFALREDRTMFFFVVADRDSDVFSHRNLAEQKTYLAQKFRASGWECPAIVGAMRDRADLYLDRVSQIRLPRWSKGRVALLGDAAFAPSLLAGQGAALAVIGAYLLAGELANAPTETAFDRYEQRLRPLIEKKQSAAVGLGRAFAPETRIGLHIRNLVTRAFDVKPLARLALGPSVRDDLVLPDYRFESEGVDTRSFASTSAS